MSCIKENVFLAPYTYYKIGGPARYFAEPTSLSDLEEISDFLKKTKNPFFILGSGSNVLMDDDGFSGLVIYTGKLNKTLELEGSHLKTGCSVTVAQTLRYCGSNGLGGLEFLVGVPGNMGGVAYMNAGTKEGDISKVIQSIEVFDLSGKTVKTYDKTKIHYSYRTQKFLKPFDIVFSASLMIEKSEPKLIQEKITKLLTSRAAVQPIDKPSCGSVFKNPNLQGRGEQPAWKLISEAGLRGKTLGDAQVSEVHTNFIINRGQAKASDVKGLIELIKDTVKNRFGIQLEEEVKIVPKNGVITL